MQDVTSYVNSSSPLSLASTGGETKKSSSEKGTSKSFISIMLAQLSDTSKTSTKSAKETLKIDDKEETKDLGASTKEAKSIDEHLLSDLLKIVDALKNNTQATIFPTLKSNSQLEKILNNKTALKEFGEVKNVSDLLALSKKYDLGLEKLSFSKENLQSLQKEFPTLSKSNFFEQLQNEVDAKKETETTDTKVIATSMNLLEKNKKTENTTPISALKDLMSKETEEPKIQTATQKTEVPTTIQESEAPAVHVIQKTEEKEMKLVNKEEVVEELTLTTEKTSTKEIKTAETIATESKKTTPSQVEIVTQKTITQTAEENKIDKKAKVETAPTMQQKSTEEEVLAEIKPQPTRISEPKIEGNALHKGLTETILQTIKIEKPLSEKPLTETEVLVQAPMPVVEENIKQETTELKQPTIEVKTVQKQETTLKQPVTPRESLNQFAEEIREKIENYKPPVMKVELALNPKNLGEVDVTLLTRGNNLHVNISSNSTTMALFTQNQAEFKNALVNMGFTNLEMNFSDQRQSGGQQQGKQKNSGGLFEEFTTEQTSDNITSIEVVIPRYV